MAVQRALWLAKRLSLNLNFSFLNRISLLLISNSYPIVLTRLGGPVPDPILPEKFLGYSQESNPEPLGWQSGMLTTIPNRWSQPYLASVKIVLMSCTFSQELFRPIVGSLNFDRLFDLPMICLC